MQNHKIARIFQDSSGLFYVSDDSLPYLDATGRGFPSRRETIFSLREALRSARIAGLGEDPWIPQPFTHYLTQSGRKVRI